MYVAEVCYAIINDADYHWPTITLADKVEAMKTQIILTARDPKKSKFVMLTFGTKQVCEMREKCIDSLCHTITRSSSTGKAGVEQVQNLNLSQIFDEEDAKEAKRYDIAVDSEIQTEPASPVHCISSSDEENISEAEQPEVSAKRTAPTNEDNDEPCL